MSTFLLFLISFLIGVGRFFVPSHELSLPGTYEAFAHLWVGILIGIMIKIFQQSFYQDFKDSEECWYDCWSAFTQACGMTFFSNVSFCLGVLTIIEVFEFTTR